MRPDGEKGCRAGVAMLSQSLIDVVEVDDNQGSR
jgi:hypothetical protein